MIKRMLLFMVFGVYCLGFADDLPSKNGDYVEPPDFGDEEILKIDGEVTSILSVLESICYGRRGRDNRNVMNDVEVFLESVLFEQDNVSSSQVLSNLVGQLLRSDKFSWKTKRMLSAHIMGFMIRRCGSSIGIVEDREDEIGAEKTVHDVILRYAKWGALFGLLFIFGYTTIRLTNAVLVGDKNFRVKVGLSSCEVCFGSSVFGEDDGRGKRAAASAGA